MLKILFGEFGSGRLQRLAYFGYTILIAVVIFLFTGAVLFLIVGAEKFVGGDLGVAQKMIGNFLGTPFTIIFIGFLIAILVATSNTTAKRARDMGLSGWLFVAGYVVFSLIGSWLTSQSISQILTTIIWLGLMFIPSNTFGNKKR